MEVKIQKYMKNSFITVNGHLLTSLYSPKDETNRFLKKIDFSLRESVFVIFGLGIGRYVLELDKKLHSSNIIFIVEPVSEIIDAYNNSNFKIESDRVKVINCESKSIIGYLEKQGLNSRYIIVYVYMNYRNIFRKEYKVLIEKIRNYSLIKLVNENTIKYFDQEFTKNIIENYFINKFELPLNAMKNIYNEIPALIVSGGPSLEKNVNYINQFKGVVISGGRTVKEFLKKGIATDFMVSVDPGNPALQLIENIPSDELMPPLFTYTESNSSVVKRHNNKKILMNSSNIRINGESGIKLDVIPNGPSVANVSMAIADYLGCNPIVLIGQDLSYTDGKHHADITIKSFDKEVNNDSQTVEVDAFYGGKIKTTSSFYSMLSWFKQLIGMSKKTFINCTEGGVFIDGCQHISFESYLENQPDIHNNLVSKRFQDICHDDTVFKDRKNIDKYLEKIKKLSKKLRKSIYHSDKLQKYIYQKKHIKIEYHIKQLEEIDAFIKELMAGDSFLNYLFSSALIDFQNGKRNMTEDDYRNLKNNSDFYRNLYESVEVVKKQLEIIYSNASEV